MKNSVTQEFFSNIIDSTHCPFANKGTLNYGSLWPKQLELEMQIRIWNQEMTMFTDSVPTKNPDGFVIGAVGKQAPSTLHELTLFIRYVLNNLTIMSRGYHLTEKEVEENRWQFCFKGIRMFLVVMSSVYPRANSRYSPAPNSVFMFFQPEVAFNTFIPHSENDPKTQRLKEVIRRKFVCAGQEYDIDIVTNPSEASKYVKPLNLGEPVIKWWKDL